MNIAPKNEKLDLGTLRHLEQLLGLELGLSTLGLGLSVFHSDGLLALLQLCHKPYGFLVKLYPAALNDYIYTISGADVNGKTSLGRSPLHVAASHGHGNVVDQLLNRGKY